MTRPGKSVVEVSDQSINQTKLFVYNMTIVKASPEPNVGLLDLLQNKLGPLVVQTSEIQSEMVVKIPQAYAHKFKHFFDELDLHLERLKLCSYGISQATLEEVFMNIGRFTDPKNKDPKNQNPV